MKEVVLAFENPADPISMNKGDSWAVRTASALWRDRAVWAWCQAHPGVGPSGRAFGFRAEVFTTISFPQNRRRDPINWAKTQKHIVDGLVLAGGWPDDTFDFVVQNIPTLVVNNSGMTHVRVVEIGPLPE
jgi:hypothetical protein